MIYTIKYRPDGAIEIYKVCLVAKEFSQKYEIDYVETFTPIVKMNTVGIVLSFVVLKDWHKFQLDINNTFLNEDLEEQVCLFLQNMKNKTNVVH